MSPQPIGAVILVLDESGQKVLLGKRKNAYKAGYYGLPGGRVEMEESLTEGAKRELLEETGLQAKDLTYLGVVREKQEGYSFIHFAFVCKSFDGQPETTEPEKCEGWEWHELTNLPEQILEGHQGALDLLKDEAHLGLKDLL